MGLLYTSVIHLSRGGIIKIKTKLMIQKVRIYLRVKQLKKELSKLRTRQSDIHWSMQFDKLSKTQIDHFNNEDNRVELLIKVKQAQLKIYGLADG
jgi:cell division FtsZ-interacting protein ZapD